MPDPNQESLSQQGEPLVSDLSFSDHVLQAIRLSGDPKDRLILELAGEIDNLERVIKNVKQNSIKAQASTRRVNALEKLWKILAERESKQLSENAATLLAGMMRKLKGVLSKLDTSPEQIETILNGLMVEIEKDEGEKMKRRLEKAK